MNEDVDVDVKQTKNKRDVNIIIWIKKQTTSKQTKTNNRTFPIVEGHEKFLDELTPWKLIEGGASTRMLYVHLVRGKKKHKIWFTDVCSKRRIPCSFLFFFLVFLFSPPWHSFILKKHAHKLHVSLNEFIKDEDGLTFPTITEINHTRISWGPSLYSSTGNKKKAFGIHKHKHIRKDTNKNQTRTTGCSWPWTGFSGKVEFDWSWGFSRTKTHQLW